MPSFARLFATGRRLPLLTTILGLALAPAAAQSVTSAESYPAEFFTQFLPQTALDMIQQVPGFQFAPGDESVRGFASGGGNVLVDGDRPASKSGGLSAALSAIPANRVARIEIVRGGVSAAQASGLGVIANIVLNHRNGSITVAGATAFTGGHMQGNLSAMANRTIGAFDLTSNTMFEATGERSSGSRLRFAPDGTLRQRERLTYETNFPEWSERLTLNGPIAGGQLKSNAMLAHARLAESFEFADAKHTENAPKRTARWRGEASASWTRDIGNSYAMTLLGLARFVDLDATAQNFTGAVASTLEEDSRFESTSLSQETILSVALNKSGGIFRPEMRAEISWNTLDNLSRSTSFSANLPAHPSVDHAMVAETRMEAFAALNWSPGVKWLVTAGAAYELSAIRATDVTTQRRRYSFFRPRFALSWKPDAWSDIRLSARRTVGQLSLGDFAASVNLAEGTALDGNTQLRPDHRTSITLDASRRFGKRGAFNLNLFRDWRRDVLEAGILPSGSLGTVNVAAADAWGASANLELPTEPVIRNGLLKVGYSRFASNLTDPITGERRRINSTHPVEFNLSFRQDMPAARTSWGIDYSATMWNGLWYGNEVRQHRHSSTLDLFVESTRFLGSKLRLQANGLIRGENRYYRSLFAANRNSALFQREIWDIKTQPIVTASISRSF